MLLYAKTTVIAKNDNLQLTVNTDGTAQPLRDPTLAKRTHLRPTVKLANR